MFVTKTSPHAQFWVLPQIFTCLHCSSVNALSFRVWIFICCRCPSILEENNSVDSRPLTCANEHHIILAIFCIYPIHHDLCELVIHVCFDHDGTVVDGEYWVVHGGMASGKCDNFIRKVLGGIKTSKCFTGTLGKKKEKLLIIYHPIYSSL